MIPSLKRRLFSGGLWSFIGRVLGAALYLLLNMVLVRILEPDQVGLFFICLSVATGAALFAQLGVSQASTKLIAEAVSLGRNDELIRLVVRIFAISGSGIILVALLLYTGVGAALFASLFDQEQLVVFLPWVIVWMSTVTLLVVLSEIFRGFHDIRSAALLGGSQSSGVLSIGITILIWLLMHALQLEMNLGVLIKVLVIVSVLTILMAISGLVFKLSRLGRLSTAATEHETRHFRLLPLLPYFFLFSMTVYVMQQSDLWIVAATDRPEAAAIYGSVSRLVFAIGLPLMIVNGFVPPMISELLVKGRHRDLEKILRGLTMLATVVAAIGVSIVVLAGEEILTFLFGSYYAEGYLILVILSVGKFVNVFAGSAGLLLLMGGEHRLAMMLGLAVSVFALIAASLAASRYGSVGVAVVFSGSLVLHNALLVFAAYRKLKIRTYARWFSATELRSIANDIH